RHVRALFSPSVRGRAAEGGRGRTYIIWNWGWQRPFSRGYILFNGFTAYVVGAYEPILLSAECLPVEEQGFGCVLLGVIPAMVAGIKVRFVRIAGFREHLIELAGANIKAIIVFGTAVEIKFQAIQFLRVLRERHWVVSFPICEILVDSIDSIKKRLESLQPSGRYLRSRQVLKQDSAMCACRPE